MDGAWANGRHGVSRIRPGKAARAALSARATVGLTLGGEAAQDQHRLGSDGIDDFTGLLIIKH